MSIKITFSKQGNIVPYGPILLAHYINSKQEFLDKLVIEWNVDANSESSVTLETNDTTLKKTSDVAKYLAKHFNLINLHGDNELITKQIDQWIDYSIDNLETTDFKKLDKALDEINHHLTLRTFFVQYNFTLADIIIWGALKSSAIFNSRLKSGKNTGVHIVRWFNYIGSLDFVQNSISWTTKAISSTKVSDQPNMNIELVNAQVGKVVTRFPPEPSGYLHIGHAKAAMLNQYFAQEYKGKLIVRFDDTNPSKEKEEFEDSIKEDLELLGIRPDEITYTSDHFEELYNYATELIKKGLAYVDDTDVATMRQERMEGIPSKNRDSSVDVNLKTWKEMKEGTDSALSYCLRAKIDMSNPNKALRDPVIYRCNKLSHHRTGNKWIVYPTYDFACPVVDSIEGVTHALRTNEYRDRNAQYYWFIDSLNLRKVHVWDFSRMNFVYTLLSKRKLQWFVDQGYASGWDDPRFPTIRGIRRRGLKVEALKQYILSQGASQNDVMLEWDKLWALNKKIIDPIAPRHTAILEQDVVKVKILEGPENVQFKLMPKHKKNTNIGSKKTWYAPNILVEQEDAKSFELNEEITLMDWGNAIVKSIIKLPENPDKINSLEVKLHLEGDFKKTKKKITWLSDFSSTQKPETHDNYQHNVEIELIDYDYLINRRKLEEADKIEDCITEKTEFIEKAIADSNIKDLKKGDIIQFERKGFYILDNNITSTSTTIPKFIYIPDGKAKTMASKAN
ncbi:414_t:CDS:10 [Entrophospora sp. SA101]|nr:15772_t:CDS:10 [Entrophospora sp. SA101]CAJ0747904.1 414_t:CDS:10 [Entrophospora sp. SA101]CAJ0846607.1 5807_t:CDS:10 [Entrophospora sp. SA101]CAJ0891872.1 13095_t:CDS:10 [Entrophospora sp. SA101]